MFILTETAQITTGYLFLGYVPETIAVLLFGISLIALTIGIRWMSRKREEEKIQTDLEEATKTE